MKIEGSYEVYELYIVIIFGRLYFIFFEKVNEGLLGILYCFFLKWDFVFFFFGESYIVYLKKIVFFFDEDVILVE